MKVAARIGKCFAPLFKLLQGATGRDGRDECGNRDDCDGLGNRDNRVGRPARGGLLWLIIATAWLLAVAPAKAQIGEQRYNFSIGFGGGMTMNSVSFSPSIRQKSLKGIMGGVAVRYISEKYFNMICGAQMELNYAQHGWDEAYEDYPDLQYTRKMNYVEVPLMAHLAFGRDRGFQMFVHAGPQIGFFLGDSYTISSVSDWKDSGLTTDQHDKAVQNKFDYGIVGGVGMEIRTKIGHFQLEGRYYYALSDFYGNTKSDYFSRSAHGVITVRIGYMIDLTK